MRDATLKAPCGCRERHSQILMCMKHQASWRELLGRAATERRLYVKPEPMNKQHPTQAAKESREGTVAHAVAERRLLSRLGVLPAPRPEAVVKNKREPW